MESYRAAGVPAEMIEGSMTNKERETVLDRFRSGETLVICNVQLLIEGVDIPSIEVVQWLRPTQSLIVWMQGCGRGLRRSEGKERLLILDQVGNWSKHGLPDEDREWSLEGRKKRKRKTDDEADVNVQQCKHCFHIFRPGPSKCPSCDNPVEVRKKADIQVVDGELEKIDLEAERKARKMEQGQSRGLRDLVALGVRRGMKNPSGWAAHVWAARHGKKPTGADYQQAKRFLAEVRG